MKTNEGSISYDAPFCFAKKQHKRSCYYQFFPLGENQLPSEVQALAFKAKR